jgi:spore maturation protein CgeB
MHKIIYIGALSGTSQMRADALRRLGCQVEQIDPVHLLNGCFKRFPRISNQEWRIGYLFSSALIAEQLPAALRARHIYAADLCWIDNGERLNNNAVRFLKAIAPTILFNHDDPTGTRDGNRFATLRKALPSYDLVALVREQNVVEARALGASHLWLSGMSYDERAHAPPPDDWVDASHYVSEVAFVGTLIPGEQRDEFAYQLIKRGVPLAIWGARWQRSRYWDTLKAHYRGGELSGHEYVAALCGAKICLGLLSKGNRDEITTRSYEIPYAGGLLCAERTEEHLKLYQEDKEAVFFSSVDECAAKCLALLQDDARREQIRQAGMAKVRSSRVGHEDRLRDILQEAVRLKLFDGLQQ